MPQDLSTLRNFFAFGRWANRMTLESVAALTPEEYARPIGGSFGSVKGTLIHLCEADWIWLERLHGRSPRAFPAADEIAEPRAARRGEVETGQTRSSRRSRRAHDRPFTSVAGITSPARSATRCCTSPTGTYHREAARCCGSSAGRRPGRTTCASSPRRRAETGASGSLLLLRGARAARCLTRLAGGGGRHSARGPALPLRQRLLWSDEAIAFVDQRAELVPVLHADVGRDHRAQRTAPAKPAGGPSHRHGPAPANHDEHALFRGPRIFSPTRKCSCPRWGPSCGQGQADLAHLRERRVEGFHEQPGK